MSQESVLRFLKNKDVWRTTKEVSNGIKVVNGSALHSLNILYKNKEIYKKTIFVNGHHVCAWRIK